jgi:hypothetical protein
VHVIVLDGMAADGAIFLFFFGEFVFLKSISINYRFCIPHFKLRMIKNDTRELLKFGKFS